MSCLHDTVVELQPLLKGIEPEQQEAIIKFVGKKVLESYHNGMKADRKPSKKFYKKGRE